MEISLQTGKKYPLGISKENKLTMYFSTREKQV
jgi:hypothetical protein